MKLEYREEQGLLNITLAPSEEKSFFVEAPESEVATLPSLELADYSSSSGYWKSPPRTG